MNRMTIFPGTETTQRLRDVYRGLQRCCGRVGHIRQGRSLFPKALRAYTERYRTIPFGKKPKPRFLREMRVMMGSQTNRLMYRVYHYTHTGAAALHREHSDRMNRWAAEDPRPGWRRRGDR